MLRIITVLLLVVLGSGSAWAGTMSLDFNNESAQFNYKHLLTREAYGDSIAGFRLLYNEDTETFLGTVAAGVVGTPGNVPGLETGVDISASSSESDNEKMFAIAVGLTVDYSPPVLGGLGVLARAHYAPKVFTFMDAEKYLETGVEIHFSFMPRAELLLSYQNVMIDFEKYDDVRVDDSVRIGIRLEF